MAQERVQLAAVMVERWEAYTNASEEETGHRVLEVAISKAQRWAVADAYLIADNGEELTVFVSGSWGSHGWIRPPANVLVDGDASSSGGRGTRAAGAWSSGCDAAGEIIGCRDRRRPAPPSSDLCLRLAVRSRREDKGQRQRQWPRPTARHSTFTARHSCRPARLKSFQLLDLS